VACSWFNEIVRPVSSVSSCLASIALGQGEIRVRPSHVSNRPLTYAPREKARVRRILHSTWMRLRLGRTARRSVCAQAAGRGRAAQSSRVVAQPVTRRARSACKSPCRGPKRAASVRHWCCVPRNFAPKTRRRPVDFSNLSRGHAARRAALDGRSVFIDVPENRQEPCHEVAQRLRSGSERPGTHASAGVARTSSRKIGRSGKSLTA